MSALVFLLSASAPTPRAHLYSGQATPDGVLFRGERHCALAVRDAFGVIQTTTRIAPTFLARWRQVPMVRGVGLIGETISLGMWAMRASPPPTGARNVAGVSQMVATTRVAASLVLSVALFFLLPYLLLQLLPGVPASPFGKSVVEGLIRAAVFVTYAVLIGFLSPVRQALAYHGAEHMVALAFQQGRPLQVETARAMPRVLPQCGTAVLLTVVLVSAVLFAPLGWLAPGWAVAARVLLTPIIAALSMEVMILGAKGSDGPVARALAFPGLQMQRLTTRAPTDEQLQVAIRAMETVQALDMDQGQVAS